MYERWWGSSACRGRSAATVESIFGLYIFARVSVFIRW